MPEILTIAQVAERLQLSPRRIYELTRERNRVNQKYPLPMIRIGRSVRFKAADIDGWIEKLKDRVGEGSRS